MEGYKQRRKNDERTPLFSTSYRINPYHDINGVGLLYFAAYPTISDTCELEFRGRGDHWANRASTISRDVCYFANSDPQDVLQYDVLSDVRADGLSTTESMLSRVSDGAPMAHILTRKSVLDD